MQEKLISVIVPVYNVELYLKDCVESLLNQTYKNLEIILVDDGSTDNSGVMCDEYGNKSGVIRVIHQRNGGLSNARNTGLKAAKGHYVCFVDSDDYVNESYLQILYSSVEENHCPIAECGVLKFNDGEDLVLAETSQKPHLYSSKEWLTESGVGDFLNCAAWNKIYERALFDDIQFPDGRVYEDEATTYKLVYKANRVYRCYQKLYYYRVRSNSIITSNITEKKLNDSISCLQERAEFFDSLNEVELADFSYAKHCISIISSCKKYGAFFLKVYGGKKAFISDVISIFRRILLKKIVPAKYKIYILFYLIKFSIA